MTPLLKFSPITFRIKTKLLNPMPWVLPRLGPCILVQLHFWLSLTQQQHMHGHASGSRNREGFVLPWTRLFSHVHLYVSGQAMLSSLGARVSCGNLHHLSQCAIYLFLAMLGLRCCMPAFPSCGKQGLFFIAVHELLTAVASLITAHRLHCSSAGGIFLKQGSILWPLNW